MNERIRELMDETVRFRLDPDSNGYEAQVSPEDLEVFAELIVRECADNIAGNIDLINPESSYNYGLRRAMNSVKQHFGVEE
jgi:hypothetical protein